MAKKKIKKKVKRNTKTKGKKLRLSIGVTVLLLVILAYVGVSFYFTEHFFVNTEINGHDFSGKTVKLVKR